MNIRASLPSDLPEIKNLYLEAFSEEENEELSKLALDLAGEPFPALSLVAVENEMAIGHVVFTPIVIANNDKLSCFILAPLAVLPSKQKQGLGRQLIQFGLDVLTKNDVDAVFVLGDPAYYSRSGFHTGHGISPPYSLAYPEAWQAKELKPGALQGLAGRVECVSALMSPEFW